MDGDNNKEQLKSRPPFPCPPAYITINPLAINHIKDFAHKIWKEDHNVNQYTLMFRALELFLRSKGVEPGFRIEERK